MLYYYYYFCNNMIILGMYCNITCNWDNKVLPRVPRISARIIAKKYIPGIKGYQLCEIIT